MYCGYTKHVRIFPTCFEHVTRATKPLASERRNQSRQQAIVDLRSFWSHFSRDALGLLNYVGIDGREVVVPVVVLRPFVAGQALGIEPHLAAFRAAALRVERVPGMAAATVPAVARAGLPFAFGAVDFHGAAEKAMRFEKEADPHTLFSRRKERGI